MNARRLVAIVFIFALASLGWLMLAGTVSFRTHELDTSLSAEMASLWGPDVLVQIAPRWVGSGETPRNRSADAAEINVVMDHATRNKGLLWFSTFKLDFDAAYSLAPDEDLGEGAFVMELPAGARSYDRLEVSVDGRDLADASLRAAETGTLRVPMSRDEAHEVRVRYATRGRNVWLYSPSEVRFSGDERDPDRVFTAEGPLRKLENFSLTVQTNFADIDYPKGSQSPSTPAGLQGDFATARWTYASALTTQPMGVAAPAPVNAGPATARMSMFAPIGLAFFFAVLLAIVITRGVRLHPMHCLFIAAGFFAFHILLAYLVDVIDVHLAFWISAAVSTALVISYMRLVVGLRLAVVHVGVAQLVFLVGFSYAFLAVGRTGLTITIGAIVTLFVLMQMTGRVDWHSVLGRQRPDGPSRPDGNTEPSAST